MSFVIRNYRKSDYPEVWHWWVAQNETPPTALMLPEESTFVCEIDGQAALCVTLYLINTKAFAWADNFIGNPLIRGPLRREASQALSEHVARFARERGYERLFCLCYRNTLEKRYNELGFRTTLRDVVTFVKEL